ncbi:MAG: hypothetical protein R2710_23340 [Acidimicrobiales bacterium]
MSLTGFGRRDAADGAVVDQAGIHGEILGGILDDPIRGACRRWSAWFRAASPTPTPTPPGCCAAAPPASCSRRSTRCPNCSAHRSPPPPRWRS